MSNERTVKWEWGDNNLAWTAGRELTTSLGPAFGLGDWFVVIPQDGRPRAVIPPTRSQAIEWLNLHEARLELSKAPTVIKQDLVPGLNQVTAAGPSRLGKILHHIPGQLVGVFRTWLWNLPGHQPQIEPPRHDAIVYYPISSDNPDLLVIAQLHATSDWPAFAFQQSGETVVKPWEPIVYDSKKREQTWAFHRPLAALEWAHPYDWCGIVRGVRAIQTHIMCEQSGWHECGRGYSCKKYYRTKELHPLDNPEKGRVETDDPFLTPSDAQLPSSSFPVQPPVSPYLPSGRCPDCGGVTFPCQKPDDFDILRAKSEARRLQHGISTTSPVDEDTEGHMAELMEWQPSIFD